MSSDLIERSYNGVMILQRRSDEKLNATAMCKACGKLFAHYRANQSTQEFLEALSSNIGIPILDLVQAQVGGNHSGTWVHRKVALHLAQWLDARFAVQVIDWVDELLTNGRVEAAPPTGSSKSPLAMTPQQRLDCVQGCHSLLLSVCNNKLEERDRRLVAEASRNILADLSGSPGTAGEEMPINIVDLAGSILGRTISDGDRVKLGKHVAAAYRKARGEEPHKHGQSVNGRWTPVNSYCVRDLPIVEDAIRDWAERMEFVEKLRLRQLDS
jgi:hypothetical protein